MREGIERRLRGLREEFQAGQARLRELETQEAFLRERLLMLKGAIQVLEELQHEDATDGTPAGAPEVSPAGPAQ